MDGDGNREIETPPDFPGVARRLECYHGTLRALLADCYRLEYTGLLRTEPILIRPIL